jgi:antitoxin CptB
MSNYSKNRIFWQSRRGMLELDLLLQPFVAQCYEKLNPEKQRLYQEFLTYEDQEIYAWLMEREKPDKSAFEDLIRLILENPHR